MIFILLFFCHFAMAADPRWEEEGPRTLQLRMGLLSPGLDFTLKGPGPDIIFVPNTTASPYFGLAYRKLGVSFQIPTNPDEATTAQKGHTDIRDYQLRFFGHRSTHELFYQRFKGYSLQDWQHAGAPVLRPDLTVRFIGMNFFRSLSPANYSKAVAFDQKGVQFRNGGALFVWASAGETKIEGYEPLVPAFLQNQSSQIGQVENFTMYSGVIGLGYGHLIPIFNRFYFTASGFVAGGLNYNKTDLQDRTDDQWAGLHRISARAGTGYNYGNHIGGGQMIVDSSTANVRDGEIQQSTFTIRLFYAYRWQALDLPSLDQWVDRVQSWTGQ